MIKTNSGTILCHEYQSIGSTGSGKMLGIVLLKNSIGQISCRIGICEGEDEKFDLKQIAERGGKLRQREALAFFKGMAYVDERKGAVETIQAEEDIEKNWKQE